MSVEFSFQVISLSEVPDGNQAAEPQKQRTVLVVDDERIIADTLSVILAKNGFSVLTAYEAESALRLADSQKPDLLLSDVMMGPGMDGTQLAIKMVAAIPDCKVLLFSGNAATVDLLANARSLGHNFTLMTKPVHPADLLAHIKQSFASESLALQY